MTTPMRLFLAVNLAGNADLRKTLEPLKTLAKSGSYTAPHNLHITLNFIGETNRASDLVGVLNRVAPTIPAFPIHFGELGLRGRTDDALVWLRGRSDALARLQSRLEAALCDTGFDLERRAFLPHVTLGRRVRFPSHLQPDEIRQSLEALNPDFSVPVRRICLMSSEREKGALVYREIHSAPLAISANPEV